MHRSVASLVHASARPTDYSRVAAAGTVLLCTFSSCLWCSSWNSGLGWLMLPETICHFQSTVHFHPVAVSNWLIIALYSHVMIRFFNRKNNYTYLCVLQLHLLQDVGLSHAWQSGLRSSLRSRCKVLKLFLWIRLNGPELVELSNVSVLSLLYLSSICKDFV